MGTRPRSVGKYTIFLGREQRFAYKFFVTASLHRARRIILSSVGTRPTLPTSDEIAAVSCLTSAAKQLFIAAIYIVAQP